jgi:hypothetical protein
VNAIYLTLFVSLVLVLAAGVLFGFLYRQRSHQYSDRLSLLPLDSDEKEESAPPTTTFPQKESRS